MGLSDAPNAPDAPDTWADTRPTGVSAVAHPTFHVKHFPENRP